MKIETISVSGISGAILGMRLPMCLNLEEAKNKSDSVLNPCDISQISVGRLDSQLCKNLIKADSCGGGQPNSKFLRMIHVQAVVTAPTYFTAELDTYKIGTTRNSSSFMHKGTSKPFEIEDFEVDEKIKEILSLTQERTKHKDLTYPYETDEYKIYKTENGREYEIYRNGRIFSKEFDYVDNYGTGRKRHFDRVEKIPTRVRNGYYQVNLGGRNCEKWLLHRLIAFVWLENPNNLETVDHINGDKSNCSVENLEWVSREENAIREHKNGLAKRYLRTDYLAWKSSTKISFNTKNEIIELRKKNVTYKDIAKKFGISQFTIYSITKRKYLSPNSELFENAYIWEQMLNTLNELREMYLETKDDVYFRLLRQFLPMGYNYTFMYDCDYATLRNIYKWRKNHKLSEWHKFCDWIETLPLAEILICEG